MNPKLHSLTALAAAFTIYPPNHVPGFAHNAFRETRGTKQTPEPPQTEEQKQWYLNRAAERRARRAAKKQKQQGGEK